MVNSKSRVDQQTIINSLPLDGYNKERENSWTYLFNNYGDGVQSMATLTKTSRVLSSVHAISLLPRPHLQIFLSGVWVWGHLFISDYSDGDYIYCMATMTVRIQRLQ